MFTVVIPNWNGKHHLAECLDSLRNQAWKKFETIVVDNHSSDGSVEFVRQHYPEITLITMDTNSGFAAAVNAGIRRAGGAFVALLNNDTAVDARWLEALAAAISDNPDIQFFASHLVDYFDRRFVDSAGDGVDLDLGPYKIGTGEPVEKYGERRLVFGACGGGGCYRKDLFDQIGLFDEDFFAYYEDVDLSFRANWAGFRCLFVPDAIIYHKVGATAKADAEATRRFAVMTRRNLLMLIAKNYSPRMLLRHIPAILTIMSLRKIGAFFKIRSTLRRRLTETFCPEWQFLRLWSATIKKRRAIMLTRRISDQAMEERCLRLPGPGRFFLTVWLRRHAALMRSSWSKRFF
ncbi:MAG: glycosyltransferase family 2 protein [Acidobacteria bacterium]|nr:glycosyltransferase family 2 protein [Acidobacteriota bacterium]MBI3657904.1 glycosyltransferase family 2 protein [Acidobacteriota bacterium]